MPIVLVLGGFSLGIGAGWAAMAGLSRLFPDKMDYEARNTVFAVVAFVVSVAIVVALTELGVMPPCNPCGE